MNLKNIIENFIKDIFRNNEYYLENDLYYELNKFLENQGIDIEENEYLIDEISINVICDLNLYNYNEDYNYYLCTKEFESYYDFLKYYKPEEAKIYFQKHIENDFYFAVTHGKEKDPNWMLDKIVFGNKTEIEYVDFELTQEYLKSIIIRFIENFEYVISEGYANRRDILFYCRENYNLNKTLDLLKDLSFIKDKTLNNYIGMRKDHRYFCKIIEGKKVDYFLCNIIRSFIRNGIEILDHSQQYGMNRNIKDLPYIKVKEEDLIKCLNLINKINYDIFPVVINDTVTFKSYVWLDNRNYKFKDLLVYDNIKDEFIKKSSRFYSRKYEN